MLIRQATQEDFSALDTLATDLLEDAVGRRAVCDAVLASSDHALLVAEADSDVVGYAHLLIYTDFTEGALGGEVLGLVVREDYRGRGIGRALVQEACRIARERDVGEVHLCTEPDNLAAQRFYASLGAKVVGVQMEIEVR